MNCLIKILSVGLLCLGCTQTFAQSQGKVYVPDTTFKVFANSAEKKFGFSGGFNNPQFATADLNNDGKKDLVVYEKGSLQIKTFINYGSAGSPDYRYRPQYESNFPEKNGFRDVLGYMKLEDFNCDNVPDLFHRGFAGIAVYRGYYSNNELHFTYYKDLFYSPLTGNSQDFESGTFPPPGWRKTVGSTAWSRQTSGTNPSCIPKSGMAMARFNSANLAAGTTSLLISQRFRVSFNLGQEARVSFWIYRDNNFGSNGDSLSVYVSHDTTLATATYINRVARSTTINQPDTKAAAGWYQYTFPIPASITGDSLYLIFKGTSQGGNNIFLDNVYWITSPLNGDINAYVEPNGDIPGMADVDNDGDLDFLAYNIGGGLIGFYKNYRVEDGLPCDSIRVNLKDGCWGRTYQGFTMEQTLGVMCPTSQPPIPPAKVTHTGNTLCLLDYDGDDDYDYLNGGVSYSYIQFLHNGRVENNYPIDTMTAQDSTWQSSGHVFHMNQFPSAFWLDIDQDGKKDVILSPNAEGTSENYKCIAWYRNTGSSSSPVYTYQGDSLFVDQTIDQGAGSYPMIYDYNKDGKPDIFIGGDGFYQSSGSLRAKIAYYENTSTGTARSFTLQNNDFLGLDALNIRGAYPAVGDLDNDGKDDLVIGHTDGTLSFYKNIAANNAVQPQWQLTISVMKDVNSHNIDSAQNAAPFIYDINKDGKKDLILGGQPGWLYYYKNTGTPNQLSLQHQTSRLGQVKANPYNTFSAYSAPFIGKIDNSGNDYLMVGSYSGTISRYGGFQNGNVTTPYQRYDTAYSLINNNLGLWSSYRSVPAIADLDADGKYEMILGNSLGGVTIFRQALIVNSLPGVAAGDQGVEMYPNPAQNVVYVNWTADFATSGMINVDVFSVTGKKLLSRQAPATEHACELSLSQLASGTYICVVASGANKKTSKLIIMR
jgi:hypothetical protein